MVLAYSVRISRVPTYSGYSLIVHVFNYGTFTLFHLPFQVCSSNVNFSSGSPLPHTYYYIWFGLFRFRSPLLSESLFYFLFLRVIRWFSSPGSPRMTIDSSYDSTTLLVLSFLIRTSTDQGSFATPRSFSQLVTSFFGAMYQGILHTLFVAYSLLIAFSQSVEFICSRYLYVSKILTISMCFHINLIFLGLFFSLYFYFFIFAFCTLLLHSSFSFNFR